MRAQEVQPACYSEFLVPSAPFLLEDPTQDPHDMVSWSPGFPFPDFPCFDDAGSLGPFCRMPLDLDLSGVVLMALGFGRKIPIIRSGI